MFKTTKNHIDYWVNRKIDWDTHYTKSHDHPHRKLIVWMLSSIPFTSLWEVGVGGGANLVAIVKALKDKQLGGSDVSADAIAQCQKVFQNGLFHVEPGNNLMMSDKSVDVILADATLIYVSPSDIDSYLTEFKRVARNYIVLVEFHERSWWKRLVFRWKTGYNAHDYSALLEKHGYYEVMIQKIPKEYWPGTPWEEWGYLITARV